MRIKTFKILNYKSFLSSEEIDFTSGFNVIVGQNNVGKTAFVEALSLTFSNHPHKSVKTVPYKGAGHNQASRAFISFQVEKEELMMILRDHLPNFYVPRNTNQSGAVQAEEFLKTLQIENNTIACLYEPNNFLSSYLESYGNIPHFCRAPLKIWTGIIGQGG
ncbi:MAG: AAA family ATPase [candidate division Zixibacteria bacterium]|nr:AAA family ATPase [candidate division Zixibacteria bacterium]